MVIGPLSGVDFSDIHLLQMVKYPDKMVKNCGFLFVLSKKDQFSYHFTLLCNTEIPIEKC